MNDAVQIGEQWYVADTSSHIDDRTRVLKHGNSFAVLDRHGEISAIGLGERGLFHRDTRHLSRWEVSVAGHRCLLLNSTIKLDNSVLRVDQTTPDLILPGEVFLPKTTLYLRREIALKEGGMYQRFTLRNYHERSLTLPLRIDFDADFADIFEVRGATRARRGELLPAEMDDDGVLIAYRGLDDVLRRTLLRFDRRPDRIAPRFAEFSLALTPGQELTLEISVDAAAGESLRRFRATRHQDAVAVHDEDQRGHEASTTQIFTDNEQFNHWLNRSEADLRMLITQTPHGPYPYAGVPWFSTPFGRDALITSLQTLWVRPSLAAGVLRFLAAHQATQTDPAREAEPGKILHEMREGEMAALGEVPFRSYYGTADATPLFLMLAGRYWRRTGDRELIDTLWPNIEAAVNWMAEYGDLDGDGFIEYRRHADRGLVNQGWKDSDDAVFHADGRLAEGPIALCEVQAYAYDAYLSAAGLAQATGHMQQAAVWRERARRLRDAFEDRFWLSSLGTYALALDGEKRPCAVRTSNPGHVLYCGIADARRARRVAASLLGADAFNGWGIRTVYRGEARYNPMSYHNGSVWPHDTAIAAAGLARYGLRNEAARLLTGLFNASIFLDLQRMPELFCGFDRLPGQAPTLYPVACLPQAWAAGAVYMLLAAILGIEFHIQAPHVRLIQPVLPDYINVLEIRSLKYGEASADITLRRLGERVSVSAAGGAERLEVAVWV